MSVKDVFKSRLRIRALEEEVKQPTNVHRWRVLAVSYAQLGLGWVHPWVGLGWDKKLQLFRGLGWIEIIS